METQMRLEVLNGYRDDDECRRVWMTVSANALILDGFPFTPNDVVEIRMQRSLFVPKSLVIDHILFEQFPNEVIITPIGESCERLLEWIRRAGFCPQAQPMNPLLPPEPPSLFI
jgi:hypothetical protein